MRRILKGLGFLEWLAIIALVLGCTYLTVRSSVFIQPVGAKSVSISGRMYTFVRRMPFGGMDGETWSEIEMPNGDECDSGEYKPNFYQDASDTNNRITQELKEWAWPCVDLGPPFTIRTKRRVILWGWLPLIPVVTETNIDATVSAIIVPLPPPPGLMPIPLDVPGPRSVP